MITDYCLKLMIDVNTINKNSHSKPISKLRAYFAFVYGTEDINIFMFRREMKWYILAIYKYFFI